MDRRGGRRDLRRLTSFRAFAAAAVFAYHCGYNLRLEAARRLIPDGYAGVAFFFVLSGFVLTWVAPESLPARTFYRRRFARIYPLHLTASLITFAIFGGGSLSVLALNLGLVQSWTALSASTSHYVVLGLNPPSWSLSCEAFFYAIFPIVAVLSRAVVARGFVLGMVACWLWCAIAAVLLVRVGPFPTGAEIAYFVPLVRSGEFLLGAGLAVAIRSGWRPPWRLWHAVLAMLISDALLVRHPLRAPLPDVALAPLFAAVLVAGAAADLEDRPGWLRVRALVYAGEVSYAFYLIQYPVIIETQAHVSGAVDGSLLALAGTALAAVLLHHLVERPLQRLLSPRRPAVALRLPRAVA